jgi:hypothetical protein
MPGPMKDENGKPTRKAAVLRPMEVLKMDLVIWNVILWRRP